MTTKSPLGAITPVFLALASCTVGTVSHLEEGRDPEVTSSEEALGPSSCPHRDESPLAPEQAHEYGVSVASDRPFEPRKPKGVPSERRMRDHDIIELGEPFDSLPRVVRPLGTLDSTAADSDGDCLSDAAELSAGSDPRNPDSDGDGWYDGACNVRYKLVLETIKVHTQSDWFTGDELYVLSDDIRYPNNTMDGYAEISKGSSKTLNQLIATRVRGRTTQPLAKVHVELMEDDYEAVDTWGADDHMATFDLDLASVAAGGRITKRVTTDDYDYEVTFRVDQEKFADPNPRSATGDTDGDGITEANEFAVSRDLGGVADPMRKEVFVALAYMQGHPLRVQSKQMVTTQLARHGIHTRIIRSQEIPLTSCLSVSKAKSLYATYFPEKKYNAFRFAVMGAKLWNDASGVAWGNAFFMDDSTWWIRGGIRAQAGTLLHELGHTLGLTQNTYPHIDTVGLASYKSVMNYFYQSSMNDYSSKESTGVFYSHNDWVDVKASYATNIFFDRVANEDGESVCD